MRTYPFLDGEFIVIGPGCFAAQDRSVLNWDGVNYIPQAKQVVPGEDRSIEAQVADLDEELDSCAVLGSHPVKSEQELLEENRSAGLIRGE